MLKISIDSLLGQKKNYNRPLQDGKELSIQAPKNILGSHSLSITNDSSRLCLEQLKQFTIGTTLKEIPAKIGMDLEHPLPVSKAVQFEMPIR